MKIVYVHRTRATGVEAVHIGQIVQSLRDLGADVEMLSPVGAFIEHVNPSEADTPPRSGKSKLHGFTAHLPEVAFELLEIAYSLKATLEGLRRFPHEMRVGVYERYAIFGFAGFLLSRRRKLPFVLEVNYTSLTPLVRPRSRLLKPLARWLDGKLFRSATQLLAVSSYLKEHLVREFHVHPDRITVVPNAADPVAFNPQTVEPLHGVTMPDGLIIGFVGGFYPWHGLDLLIQAFARFAPDFPQAKLLLIGDGPMRSELQTLVNTLKLSERVLMPGKMAHSKLASHIAHFDIGVMPDSNLYGSPMKIFEYMAMAVPVVVPDYDPLKDVITDGTQGRIFPRHNVIQLATCLTALLQDANARQQMGYNARQSILETHNWANNAKLALNHLSKRKFAS